MNEWPRAALTEAEIASIQTRRWKAFPVDTVIAIAEAWNAGMMTADMARDLACSAASVRMLLGAIGQCGVKMRIASGQPAWARKAEAPRSPLAEKMADEQFRRLVRLAEFDPAAKRALELYQRGRRDA